MGSGFWYFLSVLVGLIALVNPEDPTEKQKNFAALARTIFLSLPLIVYLLYRGYSVLIKHMQISEFIKNDFMVILLPALLLVLFIFITNGFALFK